MSGRISNLTMSSSVRFLKPPSAYTTLVGPQQVHALPVALALACPPDSCNQQSGGQTCQLPGQKWTPSVYALHCALAQLTVPNTRAFMAGSQGSPAPLLLTWAQSRAGTVCTVLSMPQNCSQSWSWREEDPITACYTCTAKRTF